jgi:hypothetical protein
MPCLRGLVAGLSPRRPMFIPSSVHAKFVADKVALGEFLLRVLGFSPVSIIPPMLHTHLHLHVALMNGTNGRSLQTFPTSDGPSQSRNIG